MEGVRPYMFRMKKWSDMSDTCPFGKGREYRVKESFMSGSDQVNIGEIIRFQETRHSPYDSMTVFIFRNAEGDIRFWELPDGESKSKAERYFEETM